MRSGSPPRYDGVAIALHWVLGLALVAQIAFGFMLDTLAPRGTPARTDVINLHKSTGIALGVLIVLRMAWRLRHAPPMWSAALSTVHQRAALLGHRMLYTCMLLMPLSDPACRSGALGAAAVMSMVTTSDADAALVLPTMSVCLAVKVCVA